VGALVPRPGCGDYWLNQAGGSWTTGTNWSNGKPPASDEGACITANGTYDVNVSGAGGPIHVRDVQLGGSEGTQSITLASPCAEAATLDTSEGVDIGARGAVTLGDGGPCPNSVTLGGSVQNEGLLTVLGDQGGSRSIAGALINAHTVVLAAGAHLQVGARYDQRAKAILETAIGSSSSFGSLSASGISDIEEGTLHVKQIAPFKAAAGQTFPVVTSSTLSGTISKEIGAVITEGRYYEPTYSGSTLQLDVAHATLSLSPVTGAPGSTVTLRGTGYLPGDTIVPTFTAGGTETEPAEKETYPALAVNSNGEFEVKIQLPSSARAGKDKIGVKSHETAVTVRQVIKVS
jgi:hypothetical protein